jgi:folate-binding protein YgfZ
MDFAQVTTPEVIAGVTAGYRALRESAAWMDLSARGKIRATGDDRARLLHAMSTNHIEQLRPGEGCYAFFLNAQGRILGDTNILCFEDSLLLDTEPETRVKLFEHLERYIIADDVTAEDETARIATIAIEGPDASRVLQAMGATLPEAPYHWLAWEHRTVARISTTGPAGFLIFMSAAERDAFVSRLAIPMAMAEDARTVRIENAHPRYGVEITERNLVQETGQLHAVHFNKGCYLGQEIVERVRSRAQIHRVLRRIEIDTANPPAGGTKTEELEIASAVFSPALQKTVALAYVKTPFAEPGTALNFDGARAMVVNEPSTVPRQLET